MHKPSQQNPTQDGLEDPQVVQGPLSLHMRVEATPGFFEIMSQGDVSPAQVGSAITDFYSTNIDHFVQQNRQQKAISGIPQLRRQWSASGIQADYKNNQGQEFLLLDVYPERAPRQSTQSVFIIDRLLDGYVFLTIVATKPIPVGRDGYWVKMGGVKLAVDYVAVGPPAHDSGIGWRPFNATLGLYDPDAWIVGRTGTAARVSTYTDVTLVNDHTAFIWQDPDLVQYEGGYGFDPVPIPDHDDTVTFSLNGTQIGQVQVKYRDTTTLTTVLFKFGKDAVSQHSQYESLEPPNFKFLNRILPPRSDNAIPYYYFLQPDGRGYDETHTEITVTGNAFLPNGRNLFTTSSTVNWDFIGEFYDRKSLRAVSQSPHDSARPDAVLIITNDKSITWGDGRFSISEPVVVNFLNPDEFLGGGGGGPM